MTRRAYKAENENEYGYMRGEWVDVCGKEDPALDEEGKRIRRICKMYDTIEAMKEDKAVYRAVRAAIMAAHQEDGVTVADILNETEEQKQAGRIKYLVVAEEKDICTRQRTRRDDVGTRRGGGDVNPSSGEDGDARTDDGDAVIRASEDPSTRPRNRPVRRVRRE